MPPGCRRGGVRRLDRAAATEQLYPHAAHAARDGDDCVESLCGAVSPEYRVVPHVRVARHCRLVLYVIQLTLLAAWVFLQR